MKNSLENRVQEVGIETAFRRLVTVKISESPQPNPINVLEKAMSIQEAPRTILASSYSKAVDIMRTKGYTWNEIQYFLKSMGADFSVQAINSAWRKWRMRQ